MNIQQEVESVKCSLGDIKCGRVFSRDEVMAILAAAQAKLVAASPRLLSGEFKFNGNEIHGPRK